jgi:K(+)-stimulated pyrophosphate-energized sodium pump
VFGRLKAWIQGKGKLATLSAIAALFLTVFLLDPSFLRSANEAPAVVGATSSVPAAVPAAEGFKFFQFMDYQPLEFYGLMIILGIAVLGLLYAFWLVILVSKADRGTLKMQEIADAVKEGANAYLAAQFQKIAIFILAITAVLYFTYTGHEQAFRIGRALAFLAGSIFSWTVGFVGMRFATDGNVRVAAAAKRSYGEALQIGRRPYENRKRCSRYDSIPECAMSSPNPSLVPVRRKP